MPLLLEAHTIHTQTAPGQRQAQANAWRLQWDAYRESVPITYVEALRHALSGLSVASFIADCLPEVVQILKPLERRLQRVWKSAKDDAYYMESISKFESSKPVVPVSEFAAWSSMKQTAHDLKPSEPWYDPSGASSLGVAVGFGFASQFSNSHELLTSWDLAWKQMYGGESFTARGLNLRTYLGAENESRGRKQNSINHNADSDSTWFNRCVGGCTHPQSSIKEMSDHLTILARRDVLRDPETLEDLSMPDIERILRRKLDVNFGSRFNGKDGIAGGGGGVVEAGFGLGIGMGIEDVLHGDPEAQR